MTALKATVIGSRIELATEDESPSQTPLVLDAAEALFLLASLQQALAALPKNEAPVDLRNPSFVGYPDFQVGISPSGDAAVRFSIGGLPSMEFHFSDEGARKLRADLKRKLLMPRSPRPKQ